MKRTCLILICLVVAAVLSTAAVGQDRQTFARAMPDGAVFYATTQNLETVWTSIEDSNFWAKLTNLKIWSGVSFAWYDDFRDDFADMFGFEFSTDNVMAVFGREFAVALYVTPAADEGGNTTIELLAAARMNPPETVKDIVDKLVETAREEGGDDVLITSVTHGGATIQTIKTKDDKPPLQLRFTMKDDVLLLGVANAVPRIEACLDCLAGEGNALAGSEGFQKLMAQTQQDHGTFFCELYADFETLHKLVEEHVGESPELGSFANLLEMMTGSARTMAVTTHLDRGLRMKFAAEPGPAMADMMTLMQQAVPTAGTHIKYVRPDAVLYYGINSMPPLADLWPHVLKMYGQMGMGIDEIIEDAIAQIEEALEIDFQTDVIENVGTELAVVLEGLDMDAAPFPFPKLTVLLQVNDKATAKTLIDRLVETVETALPEEMTPEVESLTEEGAELTVVRIPIPMLQIELSPVIGLTENFLFISSGEAYAKETLAASKSGPSLVNSALWRSLDIPEKTNGVALVNFTELIKAARQVAQWVVTMAEMQGAGPQVKERVDSTVMPLLDCLGALKAIVAYSVVTPEGATGVYVIRVEDLAAN